MVTDDGNRDRATDFGNRRIATKWRWQLLAVLVVGLLVGAVVGYFVPRLSSPLGLADAGQGPTVREFFVNAKQQTVTIADGVTFSAWTYNGTVPGPVIRVREGDLVRIHFTNEHSVPHTMHFHGIRDAAMDGMTPILQGQSFTYEFIARPAGVWLYHCHVAPVSEHMRLGLYGAFIVDPLEGRPRAKEYTLVMSEWDTNGDSDPDFHVFNGVANQYVATPLQVQAGELVRVFVANLGFDLHTFHIHANVFTAWPSGTGGGAYVTDNFALAPGETVMLEFVYESPGTYPFHCHVVPHAEMGMVGLIQVV